MSLKVGIVGLPNVGKSTLFNALLKKRVALSANYPFATVEPNVGVVAVPDGRLAALAALVKSEEHLGNLPPLVPAVCEFVDIAGLVKGASSGEGLGNKFLAHIREVDAIIHVLRDFSDENIVRAGAKNPQSDKEVVETELILADLETIENSKIKTSTSATPFAKASRVKGASADKQNPALEKLENVLGAGRPASSIQFSEEEMKFVKTLNLLTIKPVLYIYNVDEQEYKKKLERENVHENELVICAKLEEELAELSEEERADYLKELGISQTGLERLIRKAYHLLGLISYLTAGPKEVRAWTIKKGTKAPQAAAVIHTDFEKNFIKAQVVSFDDFVQNNGWKGSREVGKARMEGRDYLIEDGDVVEFKIGS